MRKFQIYYKAKENENYTLSISRIDEVTNTYKLRVIFETFDKKTMDYKKIKIREFHIGIKEILNKIEQIDFNKKYSFDKKEESYYQISYEDKKINATNVEEIKYILDLFNFSGILDITPNEYEYVKDVFEYVHLRRQFIECCSQLSETSLLKVTEKFLNSNPYEIFENISYLEKYCNSL